ncbi:MAG: hypothetical protein AAB481_00900, partial [Patescibacteria group bacterium]
SFFKKQTGALLSVLIFISFPMTIDKTIDIRPDMLMVAMVLLAMLSSRSLFIGLYTGLSLMIHPKIVFALPMFVYLSATSSKKLRIVPVVIGFLVPFLLFFLYLAHQQALPAAYTSILRDSVVANTGKGHFSPLQALSPFPLVYVANGGISLPWLVNTALWITSGVGLIFLWIRNKRLGIAMVLYFVFGIGLLFVFPVPFLQYFIPLTAMASILAGFTLSVIPGLTRNPVPKKHWIPAFAGMTEKGAGMTEKGAGMTNPIISILIPFLLFISFFLQYRERVAPTASNSEQLQVLRDVSAISRPDETFYDMVGSYVFRTDGYFICCHPYGEFIHLLASSLPAEVPPRGTKEGPDLNLTKSLIRRQTKFLVLDRIGFVFWQTPEPDLSFLLTNYLPTKYNKIYSLGLTFRCVNGACTQYRLDDKPAANRSTNTFSTIIPETYTVTIEPSTTTLTIDGNETKNGQTIDLAAGPHRFLVSPTTTLLRVQLDR